MRFCRVLEELLCKQVDSLEIREGLGLDHFFQSSPRLVSFFFLLDLLKSEPFFSS